MIIFRLFTTGMLSLSSYRISEKLLSELSNAPLTPVLSVVLLLITPRYLRARPEKPWILFFVKIFFRIKPPAIGLIPSKQSLVKLLKSVTRIGPWCITLIWPNWERRLVKSQMIVPMIFTTVILMLLALLNLLVTERRLPGSPANVTLVRNENFTYFSSLSFKNKL